MAKIPPEKVFNQTDLHGYNTCCKFYPKAMAFFGFNGHVECFVTKDNTPDYYYVEIKGFDFEVKMFASLSLDDFYGKLLLLNDVKDYIDKHDCTLTEATRDMINNNHRFYVIEQDLNDMIELKAFETVDFVDDEIEHNLIDHQAWSQFGDGQNIKNNKNKTLH
ncbi:MULTISPECIES: hypothetical protein [Cysteiniphilum]|uniref:hypothetical protein n=1 Tax=Cysteiniphilum TaxID=2056696 RepID=UPI0017823454|nr:MULTISPECIES: hypothetical protein [Cysteiniphilum]